MENIVTVYVSISRLCKWIILHTPLGVKQSNIGLTCTPTDQIESLYIRLSPQHLLSLTLCVWHQETRLAEPGIAANFY